MLSVKNMEELRKQGLNYIVGARLSNLSENLLKQVSEEINGQSGKYFKTETPLGFLVCDYSQKRADKDKSDRKKQLLKAQNQINNPARFLKRSRFIKETTASTYVLNSELIQKDELLDGIKGYYTNLENFDNQLIIDRYHDLWKIEKAFRIAKSDLLARPIFHRKRDSIEVHILIVFVSLCVVKSIELFSGLSIKKVKDLIWDVLDIKLKDDLTGNVFSKQIDIVPKKATEILERVNKQSTAY
jgi:transposase